MGGGSDYGGAAGDIRELFPEGETSSLGFKDWIKNFLGGQEDGGWIVD